MAMKECYRVENKVTMNQPTENQEKLSQNGKNVKPPNSLVFRLFHWYGIYCASRPFEVIFFTLTIIICSLSLAYFRQAKNSYKEINLKTGFLDTIIITVARCFALVYTYVQFTTHRKLGCKTLLTISSIFTVAFGIAFTFSVITFFDTSFKELNEALPFFFLFVDIPKACTLAQFALNSNDRQELVLNIGRGMALLGPSFTLDSVTMALAIGLGIKSGINLLSSISFFSLLSILANYLAFISFYPACLTLTIDLIKANRKDCSAPASSIENNESFKPNVALQKVKLVMSIVLSFLHLHTIFFTSHVSLLKYPIQLATVTNSDYSSSAEPNWDPKYLRPDAIITALLAGFLLVKYFFFDLNDNQENTKKNEGILKSIKTVTFHHESSAMSHNEALSSTMSRIEEKPNSKPQEQRPNEFEDKVEDGVMKQPEVKPFEIFEHFIDNSNLKGTKDTPMKITPQRTSKFIIGSIDNEDGEVEKCTSKAVLGSSSQMDSNNSFQLLGCVASSTDKSPRSLRECEELLKEVDGPSKLTDEEVMSLVASKRLPAYRLESALGDFQRGVHIRRKIMDRQFSEKGALQNIPYAHYDYEYVHGVCCENVIGYLPMPLGVAGPLMVDGKRYHVPMATTEGCLVASANRGCRALLAGGGVRSCLLEDGMTRAPLVRLPTAMRACEVKRWLESNFHVVAEAFNSTSRFARLKSLKIKQTSRNLYIRFVAVTGDAMGMNMLSKGSEKALLMLQEDYFHDMKLISLSSNFCTDKKPNAINWIEGRGKSIVCEAIVPGKVVREVLKTSVEALVDLNINKNFIGSSLAGSIGGSNAHAANIVTAIFIATGQDPAQNICSSNCITIMEAYQEAEEGTRVDEENIHKIKEADLYISCNMPSLEVGTVGGGTILPPQAACLQMLGVKGTHKEMPGENARTLARIVCSMVMAGELSLMASLASGDLVKSHLKHNRSSLNLAQPPQCIPI